VAGKRFGFLLSLAVDLRILSQLYCHPLDIILKNLVETGTPLVKPFQESSTPPPDPAFTLRLSDDVNSAANLYAVQKTFEGAFSFDVYYNSVSAATELSGKL